MNLIETSKKELSLEEKKAAIERDISVEIEKQVIEKYTPLLVLKGKTKIEAQSEWIKDHALDFRKFFNLKRAEILELYNSENGLEKAVDYINNNLEVLDL